MLTPEINSSLKNIGVSAIKNGCGHTGHMVNGRTELIFLNADANSGKLRIYFIIFGWL